MLNRILICKFDFFLNPLNLASFVPINIKIEKVLIKDSNLKSNRKQSKFIEKTNFELRLK